MKVCRLGVEGSRSSHDTLESVGKLNGRQSLRDIESCINSQRQQHCHLGTKLISKSCLARMNEQSDYELDDSPQLRRSLVRS